MQQTCTMEEEFVLLQEDQSPYEFEESHDLDESVQQIIRNKLFFSAAEQGDYDTVVALIGEGANINATDDDYHISALMIATCKGYSDIVKLLLLHGASVDFPDDTGATPLIEAASRGHYAIAKLLLNANAQIFAADSENNTALMKAAEHGNLAMVELLLDHIPFADREYIENTFHAMGAMKKMKNPRMPKDMRNLIKEEIINLLIEHQMKKQFDYITQLLAQKNKSGLTALSFAQISKNPQTIELLDLKNPASISRIRQLIKNNINRILFGEPRKKIL